MAGVAEGFKTDYGQEEAIAVFGTIRESIKQR